MIFNSFQRDDDDKVFTIVRNVSGQAYAAGEACVWDSGTSRDGVRVTQPAATTLCLFRGIVAEAIADSAYGKVQVHGLFTDASVTNNTSISIAAGSPLLVTTSQDYLRVHANTGTGYEGFVYAAEAYAANTSVTAAAAKDVFVRAL